MQYSQSLEKSLHFEYTNTETALLVRGLVVQIKMRLRSTILGYYYSGQLLYEIRKYLGYGQFTRWLNTSEWEYSPATAYKCISVYEYSQELGIQTEWFGTLFLISMTQLIQLLRPNKKDILLILVDMLKAGKKVDKTVIADISLRMQGQLAPADKVTEHKTAFTSNQQLNYVWLGLRFRSNPEVQIAKSLEQYPDIAFWPNCRGRLNTPNGKRNLEPDFLICYQGKLGILEVDGPFHTPERRVEEQERERYYRHHGIRVVERFDAKRCEQEPHLVVQEFLQIMEKMY
ncbi:hypothetical protein [Anabaena sp. UHCC 0399]|uniref:hypothetical protein n=1 Tax=Anabaena sp. UHCC 0399 TaxID=3110238 RepID=UPI002B2119B1|nr:hypothetical protein [Anabaena sp. UHCC 0399]MEA5569364.1 hypothetical protein [Anabaena sp. UHCC 0399]